MIRSNSLIWPVLRWRNMTEWLSSLLWATIGLANPNQQRAKLEIKKKNCLKIHCVLDSSIHIFLSKSHSSLGGKLGSPHFIDVVAEALRSRYLFKVTQLINSLADIKTWCFYFQCWFFLITISHTAGTYSLSPRWDNKQKGRISSK